MARIKDVGLNTVQLWMLWAWVEAKPGHFVFDDYDRLIELADKNGLGVILSTIGEIQPYWIHQVVPNSEMIDHMGRKVVSSNRVECHFGLTPGGCTDVPEVWDCMGRFLTRVVERYRSIPNLRGWDAWNELRWNVQSDGLVCYCDHTLENFRGWLDRKYGGLDGLNQAWQRRYGSFEEVLPGKLPGRTYTEMMAFEHFLTWRANQHGKARYDLIKGLDPNHLVTVHAGDPSILTAGSSEYQTLDRGNDWFFADDLDGVGCSSFPKWFNLDDADFGLRVECVKSAAGKKKVWLSEVQGGRAALGFEIHTPVDALSQQRWLWNGIACGADTILFWCWRDEVFGRESGGYGMIGKDGLADERIAAMKITGQLIQSHRDLLADYQPVNPQVGILFSPQSYYLCWAQESTAARAMEAMKGYARSLVRKSIPYKFIEEEHLEALKDVKILFLPRTIVTGPSLEKALLEFVSQGGTLVCESECGAFSPQGIYRYPEDRFIARATGWCEIGRRTLTQTSIQTSLTGSKLTLDVTQWLTPFRKDEETALITEATFGQGKIILCGSYFGDAYLQNRSLDFESFVEGLIHQRGLSQEVEVINPESTPDHFIYIKHGRSQGKRIVFVFFSTTDQTVYLRFREGFFQTDQVSDLITHQSIDLTSTPEGNECVLQSPKWGLSILAEK
jgi:beta-galactosidase